MTTGKRAARSQVKEMMDGFEFLMQLTAAEQAQLMSWKNW